MPMAKNKGNAPKRDRAKLNVVVKEGEDEAKALAQSFLRPSVHSAITIRDYSQPFSDIDINCMVDSLTDLINLTIDGDLSRAEAMLTAQAHTLDAIFSNLASRAIRAEYISAFETYLKLGLRAQSQSRATWETLAVIKNPISRAYVGQANIANNQQVNNSTEPSRAREKQNQPNELLENKEHEPDKWLDRGTPKETIEANQAMETVGEIDGAEVA